MEIKEKVKKLIELSDNMKYITEIICRKANLISELGEMTDFQLNSIEVYLSRLDNNKKEFIKLSNELNKQ